MGIAFNKKDSAAVEELCKYVATMNEYEFAETIHAGRRGLFVGKDGRFIEVARSAMPGQRLSVTVMDNEDKLELIVYQTDKGWYQTHPIVVSTYPTTAE